MYLDFEKISKSVSFRDLLDRIKYDYKEENGKIEGHFKDGKKFVISTAKNLFFCPTDKELKGSVINFYAHYIDSSLRDAAKIIKNTFDRKELPDLQLEYCESMEKAGISPEEAKKFGIGLVKKRSIVAGSVAFTILDEDKNVVGYFGIKKNSVVIPNSLKVNDRYFLVPSSLFAYISQRNKDRQG